LKLDDPKFPLDSYEIKARILPALIISIPVLITLWSCYKAEITTFSELFKGILSFAIIYALAIVVRALGKRIENDLWKTWGGVPSTQIVSWKNKVIGNDLKALYFQAVRDKLKLPTPTKEQEEADPLKAAELIDQAFKRIQGLIRQKDKDGLWSKSNADYGFARNLLGSRALWLIISASMAAVSAYNLCGTSSNAILLAFILNTVMTFASFYIGWFILPAYTRQVAFRYAEQSWESFYSIIAG